MLDILKILLNILSEIQNTIMEKYINLFHIVVGIIFVLIPSFIANKIITNAQLLYGLEMLGAGIIIVHSLIILLYHYNKLKEIPDEMVDDDDTTNPPSTTGAPTSSVSEEYDEMNNLTMEEYTEKCKSDTGCIPTNQSNFMKDWCLREMKGKFVSKKQNGLCKTVCVHPTMCHLLWPGGKGG